MRVRSAKRTAPRSADTWRATDANVIGRRRGSAGSRRRPEMPAAWPSSKRDSWPDLPDRFRRLTIERVNCRVADRSWRQLAMARATQSSIPVRLPRAPFAGAMSRTAQRRKQVMTQACGMFGLISRQLHRAIKSASLCIVHGVGHLRSLFDAAKVNARMADRFARAECPTAPIDEFLPIEKRLSMS